MSDFHNLIEREIPRLRRYARALTRSGDRADDLVQETILRAIAKSHLWESIEGRGVMHDGEKPSPDVSARLSPRPCLRGGW